MAIQVNRVTNANVYVEGANFLGKAKKITMPTVTQMMSDFKGLGMVAQIEVPTGGIDKMEATFEWESFYAEVYRRASNNQKAVALQVRASIDTFGGQGLVNQVPLVASLSGMFKEVPFGEFALHEPTSYPTKLSVYYLKVVVDGEELIEVDVFNNIYKAAGTDLLARFRSIIGG